MTTGLSTIAATTLPSASPLQLIAGYWSVAAVAMVISLLLTPLMRQLAMRNHIVDLPDQTRKQHGRPVAYLGGVAIFLGWLTAVCWSETLTPHTLNLPGHEAAMIVVPISIVLGAAIITLTGLFDDVYGISPRVKVAGQLFTAAALASQDVGTRLASTSFELLDLAPPAWVVYIVGTALIALFVIGGCNSMNLLDGMDGLASGVAAIACVGLALMAAIVAMRAYDPQMQALAQPTLDPLRITLALALFGAVLGFLPYNFNPATIFMGDAGSLLLGYLCVTNILLFASVPGSGPLLVTAGLIVFALPITDTSLAILRRKLRGLPISTPDHEHLHHLVRRTGLSVKQSVAVLYSLATLFAGLGCLLVAMELRWRTVLAVCVLLYATIMAAAMWYGKRLNRQQAMALASASAVPDNEVDRDAVESPTVVASNHRN